MAIFGCPVWAIPILLFLWAECFFFIAVDKKTWIFFFLITPSSSILSILLWSKYEPIVWLAPLIMVLVILFMVYWDSRSEFMIIWKGLDFQDFIFCFISLLLCLIVLGWIDYFKPGLVQYISDKPERIIFFSFLVFFISFGKSLVKIIQYQVDMKRIQNIDGDRQSANKAFARLITNIYDKEERQNINRFMDE